MEHVLFINSCVRGEHSRTLKLAQHFLKQYKEIHPDSNIIERNLMLQRMEPQYPEVLEKRDVAWRKHQFDNPLFDAAKQFAQADKIIIAAPFWDLSFPAILKIYLERISVADITFGYDNNSNNIGLCKANTMVFITTRGGNFSSPESEWMEMGARHLKALCIMYGIDDFQLLYAENLDDIHQDAELLMKEAFQQADVLAKTL